MGNLNKWEDVWHVFSQATQPRYCGFIVCGHWALSLLCTSSSSSFPSIVTTSKSSAKIQTMVFSTQNQQSLSLAELLWVCTTSSIWQLICVQLFFSGLKTVQDTIGLGEDLKCRLICLESKVFSLMKSKIQLPSTSNESKLVSHCVCHYGPWAVSFC